MRASVGPHYTTSRPQARAAVGQLLRGEELGAALASDLCSLLGIADTMVVRMVRGISESLLRAKGVEERILAQMADVDEATLQAEAARAPVDLWLSSCERFRRSAGFVGLRGCGERRGTPRDTSQNKHLWSSFRGSPASTAKRGRDPWDLQLNSRGVARL